MSAQNPALIAAQPRLGYIGLTAFLVVTNTIVPLSLDMYTPSVPDMPGYFNTTTGLVSLTLTVFQLFFSIGLLVFGPICDKYGRKPVLVASTALYTLSSVLCALSWSIWALIAFRVLQGLAAGAICTVSTAIVKDCFAEESRERMLTILQVMAVLGPVLAPILGGIIITYTHWRVTFWVLAVVGVALTACAALYKESIPSSDRLQTGVLRSMLRLTVILRNKGFMLFLLVISLFCLPFMAYIAVGSIVYVDMFGTTQQVFTYYFAATAALSALGPLLYLRAPDSLTPKRFTWVLLIAGVVCGVLLLIGGHLSPLAFCVIVLIIAICEAAARPYSTNILLAQSDRDTGSASAMLNFVFTFMGCVGMVIIVLPCWPDYIFGLAGVTLLSMVIGIALWVYLLKSGIKLKDLD